MSVISDFYLCFIKTIIKTYLLYLETRVTLLSYVL